MGSPRTPKKTKPLIDFDGMVKHLTTLGYTVSFDPHQQIERCNRYMHVLHIAEEHLAFTVDVSRGRTFGSNQSRVLTFYYGPETKTEMSKVYFLADGTLLSVDALRQVIANHKRLMERQHRLHLFESQMDDLLSGYQLHTEMRFGTHAAFNNFGRGDVPARFFEMNIEVDDPKKARVLLEALVKCDLAKRVLKVSYTPLEVLGGMLDAYQREALERELRRARKEPVLSPPLDREIEALRSWIADCTVDPTTIPWFPNEGKDCLLVNDYDVRMAGVRPLDAPPATHHIKIPNATSRRSPSPRPTE